MKSEKLIYRLLIAAIFILVFIQTAESCSMFKITMQGKTMVGNNEDFWNPNTRIWFEKGNKNEFGAAYVGYDNFMPQGGINQAGLVYDGFAMPFMAVKDTIGKIVPKENFINNLMKKCKSVDDVKNYLSHYNLSFMESGMFLFIDKTGKYLIAEGDSLITGKNQYYVLSNFCPFKIKDESEIKIPFYHKGKKLLESHRDTTISFCTSVMDTMHQEYAYGGGTMYSTLYDLEEGSIHLYSYHDYRHVVKFNLNNELAKGDHALVIPELFPENTKGLGFLSSYNETSNEINLLKNESVLNDTCRYNYVTCTLFRKDLKLISKFGDKINEIAIALLEKMKYKEAIAVLKVSIKALPASWVGYELLADAYMNNNEFKLALANYKKSVEFNPDNLMGKQQIERLKKEIGN